MVNDPIRQALYPYPENLKLVTKVGARRDAAGRVLPAQRPDELRKGVEANLHTLRVGRLDLVNLRLVETARDDGVPLEEQLLALADMRAEGKLDLIGLSNADAAKAELALRFVDVAEIQNGCSIIGRRDEDTLEFARAHGIPYVPFSPFGPSYRSGTRRLAADATIVEIADKHEATPAQIALAWLLDRYDRLLLIPGTSSIAHLEENMAALELELDDADLLALDRVGRSPDRARRAPAER